MTTAGTLTTRVRRRADAVGSDFVSDADILDMLSVAATSLLRELVGINGPDRYISSETVTVSTGGVGALLSAVMGRPLQVYWVRANEDDVPLQPAARAAILETDRNWTTYDPPKYWVEYSTVGGSWVISFDRTPATTQSVVVRYVPDQIVFASAAAVNVLGHDEILELSAAIMLLQKEERPTEALERERERLLNIARSTPTDMGEPRTVKRTKRGWLRGWV